MKQLRCRDAGFDCDAVVQAEADDEILEQAGRHAASDHGVEVTPEMAAQLRQKITAV